MSMPKIIEYKTIVADDDGELDGIVRTHISKGWQPFGGASVAREPAGLVYCQTMVKYDEPKESK